MKKRYITTSLLLLASLLLGGCSEKNNNSAPATDTSSTSVSSTEPSQPENSTEDKNSSMESSAQSSTESTESSTQSAPESTPETVSEPVTPVPVEYTDEDRELQKILSDLLPPAAEIFSWYIANLFPTPMIYINFPQYENIPGGGFALVPENCRPNDSYSLFEMPTTRDGMREIMLKYYSENYTESRVGDIVAGTLTENPDGTYSMTVTDKLDTSSELIYERFIEADGRLYQRDGIKISSMNINEETAKIISKTDDTIEFSYLPSTNIFDPIPEEYQNEPLYSENALKGVLKYERGGWKLDSWGSE